MEIFLFLRTETCGFKMLNLVWLNLALRVWLPSVKKGGGLNYALLCSPQRECVLKVANEVRLSTRRGKAEAKELLLAFTFLFTLGGKGILLTVCLRL